MVFLLLFCPLPGSLSTASYWHTSTPHAAGDLSPKAKDKLLKESWKQGKALAKEGWKVYGSASSVEEAFTAYSEALAADDVTEWQSEAQGRSINIAYEKAQKQAESRFALLRQGQLEGSVLTTTVTDADHGEQEHLSNTALLRSQSQATLPPPALKLYRRLPDGSMEIRLYYLL